MADRATGQGGAWAARRWELVASVAGAVTATLGVVVLVGWYTHTVILIQVLPALVPMQYNTALGFLLCGIGLVALVHDRTRLAVVLGSVAGAVGLLTLIEYAFGVQFGIDQLFLEHYITVQSSHPGRMAPNTALSFSLTAAALIVAARSKQPGRHFKLVGALGVVVLSLSSIALLGYVTRAGTAYGWGQMTRMAVHTSAGFVSLSLGILTIVFRESVIWAATSSALVSDKLVHERRKIVAASVGIMTLFSMVVGWTIIRELYSTGLEAQRDRLAELVRSRIRMIDAVARIEERTRQDAPGGARAAILRHILEPLEGSPGFGQTGEFTLGRREGDEVMFIVRPPRAGPDFVADVGLGSARVEAMRRALDGESGTLIGIDYSGERVVAAYAPVAPLDLGIVAKMNLAEVRAPFVGSAFLTATIALVIIAIGAGATMVSIDPLARRVETQAMYLHLANAELTREAAKREELNISLEHRVAERTAELEAANSELEAFAYSVSHDLKAPLRAIDGYSGKLAEELDGRLNPESRRLLDVVRQRAQYMGRLIDELLAFSRIGRVTLTCIDVDMHELAQTTFEELAATHAGRNIEFAVGDLPTVCTDFDLIRQVWANLLDNAIKFTGQREVASIEVGYREDADGHVFSVRDNGAGFDMEYGDKLFGVFQRLHYEDEFPGTGVGLATVRRIVERHGGDAWAEGEVDRGATIFFRLPRTEGTT